MTASYLDPRSGITHPLNVPRWGADDGAPLLITPLPGMGRSAIRTDDRSLWRYAESLPFIPNHPISLGEGCTPLVEADWNGIPLHFKCEWFSPTGSFKDRGASVMLSLLREQGVTEVLEDSSGNGGAAIACYAAAGGMRSTILAPASASPAKLLQSRLHGACVELVAGTRQACADEALRRAPSIFYASHNRHPFFLHGVKTLAYELWEQLGFRVPDHVIMPCGAGSLILGCDIAFDELLRCGAITHRPRLFAVQPDHCGPIARAFLGEPQRSALPTIAEGTAIEHPLRLRETIDALRQCDGGALLITEDEIRESTIALARRGFVVEPTCAQAAAAAKKLAADGTIRDGDTTVVVLTGTGLKAAGMLAKWVKD
jgi:threonine synthase